MTSIPVIAFAAYSGTGKTTLIEKVIRCLTEKGLRLAVIKQDAHRIQIDKEGKDSWRFAQAGADVVVVSGPEKTAMIEHRERTLAQNLTMIRDVDLILVEGYKNEGIAQIGICRKATGRGFTAELSRFAALVTDEPVDTQIPCFDLEDAEGISGFILSYTGLDGKTEDGAHAQQP